MSCCYVTLKNSEVQTYESLRKMGQQHPVPAQYPDTGALVEIMYTSGTTGNPKGVMLSHRGVLSTVQAAKDEHTFSIKGDRTLAFLPWAHIFGQICEVHGLMMFGMSAAMNENLAKLVDELGQVKPTLLFAVPRVYNRIYEKNSPADQQQVAQALLPVPIWVDLLRQGRHGEKLSQGSTGLQTLRQALLLQGPGTFWQSIADGLQRRKCLESRGH